jgi:hypothetical protein
LKPCVQVRHLAGLSRTRLFDAVISALTNVLSGARIDMPIPRKWLDQLVIPEILNKVPKILNIGIGHDAMEIRYKFGLG